MLDEDQLPDWFLWQMSHDYHATLETLRQRDGSGAADDLTLRHLRQEIQEVEDFLGGPPDRPDHSWKTARSMLRDLTSSLGPEADGPIYRQLMADPSDHVHIHVTGQPNWMGTLHLTEVSFAAIIKKAMQLCSEKQLLGPSAAEVQALCDHILR